MKKIILILMLIVLISGCAQKECKVKEDCPGKTCFSKDCIDYNCSYSKLAPCPECDDKDECTKDSFDYEQQKCINEEIVPCCGDGKCDSGETYLTCPQDCPNPKDVLEENIPEIQNYLELEQVFIDLYADDDGFTDSEIKYIKALFEIFKSKTNLHQADEEILAYLVTDRIEPHPILSEEYAIDMDYFVEEVMPLANNITKDSSNDMESVEKLVLWVRENIINDAAEFMEDRVEEILEKRATMGLASCDQYATLITALCRASGIPAREVSGGLETPGHAWIEAYVDGKWIAVDSIGIYGLIMGDKEITKLGEWLHTAYVYDSLNDRMMDVSLSYNKVALNSIIEYTKEIVGETEVIRQAEGLFDQFNKEQDLAKKYAYAQEIFRICNSEIIAEKEGYNPNEVKVIYLWDFDKISRDENFLNEIEKVKAISIYDITEPGGDRYKCEWCSNEFPLEEFSKTISEIKPQFSGKIYSLLAHYKVAQSKGPINIQTDLVVNLLNPEDTDILQAAHQDLLLGSLELLRDFVVEISAVMNETKNLTTFYLPKTLPAGVEYEIKGAGHAENMYFVMQSTISIQNIEVALEVEQINMPLERKVIYPERLINENLIRVPVRSFDNLRVINEKDEIYADARIYGSLGCTSEVATMLWSISLSGGQTLKIWRENGVIIVQGVMEQPQSETIKEYSDLLI